MSNEQVIAEQLHLAQWQDRLHDVVDQVPSPAEALPITAHLSSCVTCTREYRRLLALDARLRNEFAVAMSPSPQFDRQVFASVARLEAEKRGKARQREQKDHAARLASLQKRSRELLRYQLGNVIAGIATLAAVSTTVVSMLPSAATTLTATINKDLLAAQHAAWLPHGWSALPVLAVSVSAAIAVAAMWITRRVDRHHG